MQAVAIARALGVRTVLIPPTPGPELGGRPARDRSQARARAHLHEARRRETDPAHLAAVFDEMEGRDAPSAARGRRRRTERIRIVREIAMCYVGQSYQLKVDVPDRRSTRDTWKAMTEAFHARHADAYGFANEREPVQFVNLRLTAHRPGRPADGAPARARRRRRRARAAKSPRQVYFGEAGGMVDERHLRPRSAARRRPLRRPGDRRADGLHDRDPARRHRRPSTNTAASSYRCPRSSAAHHASRSERSGHRAGTKHSARRRAGSPAPWIR